MKRAFGLKGITRDLRLADTVRRALREDIGSGDLTTRALISPSRMAVGTIIARHRCVVAGGIVAAEVFRQVDPRLRLTIRIADGRKAAADRAIIQIRGRAASLLTAERTALNFMQRLTGIATLTRTFVDKVKPYRVAILDTRKTTPGLRFLEKYAVRCGGGKNHRFGLYDMILVKDNHRYLWRRGGQGDVGDAVETARKQFPESGGRDRGGERGGSRTGVEGVAGVDTPRQHDPSAPSPMRAPVRGQGPFRGIGRHQSEERASRGRDRGGRDIAGLPDTLRAGGRPVARN